MPSEAWNNAAVLERYVGRWSRLVAREFLAWLDEPAAAAGSMWAVARAR